MSKTIAVVHGGVTHERDKSVVYGKTVSKIFKDAGNNVIEIHLHPNGSWTRDGKLQNLENALNGIPLLWNALVGADGENSLVENLCSKCKVKILGHGKVHSELSANKKSLKDALKQHKIKTPYSKVLKRDKLSSENLKHVYQMVGIPMILKPLQGSGQKHVYFANNFDEYKKAVEKIILEDMDVLVEKPVVGKHVSCFVFSHGGLVHAHVYGEDELSKEEFLTVRNEALFVHGVLGFTHHMKYDFVLSPKGLYFLEGNTHPSLVHDEIKQIYQKGSVTLSEYLLKHL